MFFLSQSQLNGVRIDKKEITVTEEKFLFFGGKMLEIMKRKLIFKQTSCITSLIVIVLKCSRNYI